MAMSELTAEERADVIRAIKEQHPGAGPGADVDLKIYSQKANALQNSQGVLIVSLRGRGVPLRKGNRIVIRRPSLNPQFASAPLLSGSPTVSA
jgi:hypothetical protein